MENKIGKRFEGKVAVVTASTQGIGFGIAQRLGLEGASVVISSRRQEAAPHLSKGSSVVFVSSIGGYHPDRPVGMRGAGMYGVTKTALLGLTKALATEMAPDTRVNCVAPGYVATRLTTIITSNDATMDDVVGKTLLNRLGTTEEMGAAVAFLASDDASYITGETIIVAGGTLSRL